MKIIAIGRNYAEHAKELNNPIPDKPVIFLKPDTAVLKDNKPFYIPDFSSDIHYELEVVLKIAKEGKHIAEKFAHKYYEELGLGIDFTARDIQAELKKKGLPWEKAKAWDGSAVVGRMHELTADMLKKPIEFSLEVNNELVQQGNSNDMLFSFDRIIADISQYFALNIGDLIFTGTPAGVGECVVGDVLIGHLGNEKVFEFEIK